MRFDPQSPAFFVNPDYRRADVAVQRAMEPAPATTLCARAFMRLFTGGAAVAESLLASERTHAVAFTGSAAAGVERGWFYEPTILTGATQDMALMREECFGPVASVCRVADFDEAVARANDSPFGLGASVFTASLDEAMDAAERLEAGMVWVNNPLIDNDALPFGGWKMSGLGRELSLHGLDAFRRSKMVVIDHKPAIQEWWYPYPDDWFDDNGGRKPT